MTGIKWQTEYRGKRRAKQVYKVRMFGVPSNPYPPFVIHGVHGVRRTFLHHLNERAKDSESWFFENLIPICPHDNDEIDESRKSLNPRVSNVDLDPGSLLARSRAVYGDGEVARAYACARLCSFIAWPPGRPGWKDPDADPNLTVEAATQCLLCLRIVDPKDAVPLAIDTLHRSILPRLASPQVKRHLIDPTLFGLAVAAGAFHKDYGDYVTAAGYFGLAEQYLLRVSNATLGLAKAQFENHRLINDVMRLESGFSGPQDTNAARDRVGSSEYVRQLGGKMNLLYWKLRELRSRSEPESITEELKQVPLTYLKLQGHRLKSAQPDDHVSKFTPALEAEYLLIDADARANQGKLRDAEQVMSRS